MKLTKMEQMLLRLLMTANMPLSYRDLKADFPYRYVPSAVLLLSLESLQRKGMVREAGFSCLGRHEGERLYAACPPGTVKQNHWCR